MTLANDAVQYALDEYDRPDLRSALVQRVQRAVFELHGIALLARDLEVSPLVAVAGDITQVPIPSNNRKINRVVAYSSGTELALEFPQRTVLGTLDYYNTVETRNYRVRGQYADVTCIGQNATHLALEYYKYPQVAVNAGIPDTDSWLVSTDYTILAMKLCAYVAKIIGVKEDIALWENKVQYAIDALSGD